MNRIAKLSTSVFLLLAMLAYSNTEASAQEINGRVYAEADWKVSKGFHLNAEYQLRTKDSFSGIERNQFALGASYKINKYLKAGADYTFIGHYANSTGKFKPRHRVAGNLTGMVDTGYWRFSLRERLQLTHKAYGVNHYQEVPNHLELKSRLMVKYRGFRTVAPYAYIELRNTFNDPKCDANYDSSTGTWSGYEFLGYTHAYVNRVRGALGLEWILSLRHALDFRFMYNYYNELDIDTDKSGTMLKSLAWQNPKVATLCFGYKFAF